MRGLEGILTGASAIPSGRVHGQHPADEEVTRVILARTACQL